MIRLLSPLALQVVPSPLLTALRQLSSGLASHIESTFSVQPDHVTKAKLGPAVIFCSLLDRLLRVNDAAHAAARFLGNPPDREQMIKDWQNHVDGDMIVDRELPCLAPEAKKILKSEIATLLQPASSLSSSSSEPPTSNPESTESVLDRWTNFLIDLPRRFPTSSPRYFNICLGAVASAALRDLTTNGAISFGSWWVVRCWIDEWMSWQAEKGGFLNHQPPPPVGWKMPLERNNRRSKTPNGLSKIDSIMNSATNGSYPPRESTGRLLEDVGDDRVNRMVPPVYGK
jgi:regulatory factor X